MQLDLQHLLRLARRWWWLLLLAPLIGGTAAAYMSSRQAPQYESQATLLVNAGVGGGNNLNSVQAGQNLTETYSMWILSRPVLDRVADELDYAGGSDALEAQVGSATVPSTLFIRVFATATDPAEAALIANTVADQFVLYVQQQSVAQNAQVKGNVDTQIADTKDQIDELEASIQNLQAKAGPLTASEQQQLGTLLESQAQLRQDLSQLQLTARSIDVELASAQTHIMVSSPAVVPAAPFAPTTTRSTVLGVVAGIMLAASAIAILEYMDNTVRSRDEITKLTRSPVLATVTVPPEELRAGRQLFVLSQPRSSPAEAIRLLRTNLDFANATSPTTSITISSPGVGEGKSTLTANLGVVMAQAGLNTVIIDADFRRPTQHRIFGLNNERGLSTLLTQPDQDWQSGTVHLNIPNLTLIPSGPVPPNPSDLLSLDRFGRLLAQIKETADVIVIDTSPVLAVSDALVVATRTDGVLLVCRRGHTRRDRLSRASSLLEQGRIRLIGVVLNQNKNTQDEYEHYEQDPSLDRQAPERYFYGVYGAQEPGAERPSAPARQSHQKMNGMVARKG